MIKNNNIYWLTKEFLHKNMISNRIKKLIDLWHKDLINHFISHIIDFDSLKSFELIWNYNEKPKVVEIDDKGKHYKKEITKTF